MPGDDRIRPEGRYRDFSGVMFGSLRGAAPVGRDANGHLMWELVCVKCGAKRTVNSTMLASGKVRGCPKCTILRGYDLTGRELGPLTVLQPVGYDRHGNRMWTAMCSRCGHKSAMSSKQLLRTEHPRCPVCGA